MCVGGGVGVGVHDNVCSLMIQDIPSTWFLQSSANPAIHSIINFVTVQCLELCTCMSKQHTHAGGKTQEPMHIKCSVACWQQVSLISM